ncbi:IMV membrane protein [Equine molluscum contagiosum-like virus]|nr:IMV membrane protein [Equine molluscum contagiosum-like virus]
MALAGKDVASAVGLTVLMLLMVISGGALVARAVPPARVLTMRSAAAARWLHWLEIFAVILFIPGTITLYAAYVRRLSSA